MPGTPVRVERFGAVTTVVLDRPEVKNAVDREVADALDAAFEAFERDDEARVRLPRIVGLGRALDLVLTGRSVAADEALRIGLADRVVPRGQARAAAEALAAELAALPQTCLLGDRRSVDEGLGLPLADALRNEHAHGLRALEAEALAGARRFAAGQGRHGERVDA